MDGVVFHRMTANHALEATGSGTGASEMLLMRTALQQGSPLMMHRINWPASSYFPIGAGELRRLL
jgi:hypothetical protein